MLSALAQQQKRDEKKKSHAINIKHNFPAMMDRVMKMCAMTKTIIFVMLWCLMTPASRFANVQCYAWCISCELSKPLPSNECNPRWPADAAMPIWAQSCWKRKNWQFDRGAPFGEHLVAFENRAHPPSALLQAIKTNKKFLAHKLKVLKV